MRIDIRELDSMPEHYIAEAWVRFRARRAAADERANKLKGGVMPTRACDGDMFFGM